MHVIKLHLALHIRPFHRFSGVGRFFHLFQKGEYPFGGRGSLLQHVGGVGQLSDGLVEVAHVLHKSLDIAHGDAALHHLPAAQNGHQHIADVTHQVRGRRQQAGEELRLPGRFVEGIVVFVKLLDTFLLAVEGFHHQVTAIHLFHMPVDMPQVILLLLEVFLRFSNHQRDHQY